LNAQLTFEEVVVSNVNEYLVDGCKMVILSMAGDSAAKTPTVWVVVTSIKCFFSQKYRGSKTRSEVTHKEKDMKRKIREGIPKHARQGAQTTKKKKTHLPKNR
jgi:hypothetical protein